MTAGAKKKRRNAGKVRRVWLAQICHVSGTGIFLVGPEKIFSDANLVGHSVPFSGAGLLLLRFLLQEIEVVIHLSIHALERA